MNFLKFGLTSGKKKGTGTYPVSKPTTKPDLDLKILDGKRAIVKGKGVWLYEVIVEVAKVYRKGRFQ